MSDERFHSPYQFIPVTGRIRRREQANAQTQDLPGVETTPWEEIKSGNSAATHEYWQGGLLSGQLLCRLKTVSPTLVGAQQQKEEGDNIETIANYRSKGKIAIPGSSLRGVIGSAAEAISQSALRVLGQREFSVRKSMHESLMGIGMLRKTSTGWRLLPLAITSLEIADKNEHGRNAALMGEKWRAVFPAGLPMSECLAVHFGDYRKPAGKSDAVCCFQGEDNARFAWSHQASSQPFRELKAGDVIKIHPNSASTPLTRIRGIAVRPAVDDVTLRAEQVSSPAQRGVCFVLGKREKRKDGELDPMKNKFYEWFVPYAEDWEDQLRQCRSDGESTLEVKEEATKNFEFVAAERWKGQGCVRPSEDSVPYLPKGYESSTPPRVAKSKEADFGFLRNGDLVYFDVDDNGKEVTELSFSSIWRARVKGDLYGAFERTAGKDALPWSPDREGLTPAERIFGVVDDSPEDKSGGKRTARNLASRVRFSDALGIHEPNLLDRVALRQLQSPKPPSPSMYFRASEDGGAVRKRPAEKTKQSTPSLPELNLRKHFPNGRKHYLVHDTQKLQHHRPWVSKKLREALAAARTDEEIAQIERQFSKQGGRWGRPIEEDQELWFHVDFDNLTADELGLLCSAIDPSTNSLAGPVVHHHRIGWGKPAGLGVVRINIDGRFLIDRRERYRTSGLEEPRWHAAWVSERLTQEQCAALRVSYPALAHVDEASRDMYLKLDSDLVDAQAFYVLIELGDLQAVDDHVCYPYANGKRYEEEDGFEWFSNNDQQPDGNYQHLRPVQASDNTGQGKSAETPRLPWLKPQ